MSATAQQSKLAALRAKTDRDLVALIDNALELGMLLAANEFDVDAAGALHRRAAQIYADMSMLVTLIENLADRRRLGAKLSQLRDVLDRRMKGLIAGAAG